MHLSVCLLTSTKICICVVQLPECFPPDTWPHLSIWWRFVAILPVRISIKYRFGVGIIRYGGTTRPVRRCAAAPPFSHDSATIRCVRHPLATGRHLFAVSQFMPYRSSFPHHLPSFIHPLHRQLRSSFPRLTSFTNSPSVLLLPHSVLRFRFILVFLPSVLSSFHPGPPSKPS